MEVVWVYENIKKSDDWNSRLNYTMLFASVSLWRRYNPLHYTVLYADSLVLKELGRMECKSLWHEIRLLDDDFGRIDKLSFWSGCKTKIISDIKVPTLMVDHDSLIFRNMDEYIGDELFFAYDEYTSNYYPSENDIWNQKLDNPIKYVNDRAANVSLLYFPQVEFAHRYGKITLQNHQKLSSLNNFNTNANYMILSEQLMLRQMVDVENIPFFPLAKNIWDCHQIRYTGDTEPKGKWSLNEAHKYYKHYGVEKGRLIGNYEQPQRNLTYEREIEYLNRCIKAGKLIDTESLFKKINEIKQP